MSLIQNKTKQNKTKQNKTKQNKTKQTPWISKAPTNKPDKFGEYLIIAQLIISNCI